MPCEKRYDGDETACHFTNGLPCFPIMQRRFAFGITRRMGKDLSTTRQARVEQLLALGHDYAELERNGVLLVVNKIACKYLRPCRFGDTLRVQIRTVRARGARIDHEYRVLRGHELLAEAESTLACIDREGRVQRLPDYLLMDEDSAKSAG
jgi:acyl-CoA thioester hydrolase